MVLTTVNYDLPYQEASDRPCDAPVPFKESAELIAAQLQAMDLQLARLAPARPAVQFKIAPQVIPLNTFANLAIDEVVFDTDDMIDLDRSVFRARPRRTGWYVASGWLKFLDGGNVNEELSISLTFNSYGASIGGGISGGGWIDENTVAFTPGSGFYTVLKTTAMRAMLAADLVGLGFGLGMRSQSQPMNILDGMFSMYWVRDL